MKIPNKLGFLFVFTLALLTRSGSVRAGLASTAVSEVVEQLLEKGGREVAGESAESITRKLTMVAGKYGPEGVEAARRGGPTAFRYLVEGGEEAPKIVKLFEEYGDSAIHIVSRPKSMAIFIKYGDGAAAAMIRHPGIAEDLIAPFGTPAARALSAVESQNGRRLAMMAEDGTLTAGGRSTELLDTIARYGDKGMEFIWKNKGSLTVGATLAAFLTKPEPFINGTIAITKAVAVPAVEKAGDAAVTVARNRSGTLLALVVTCVTMIVLWRWVNARWERMRVKQL